MSLGLPDAKMFFPEGILGFSQREYCHRGVGGTEEVRRDLDIGAVSDISGCQLR